MEMSVSCDLIGYDMWLRVAKSPNVVLSVLGVTRMDTITNESIS